MGTTMFFLSSENIFMSSFYHLSFICNPPQNVLGTAYKFQRIPDLKQKMKPTSFKYLLSNSLDITQVI